MHLIPSNHFLLCCLYFSYITTDITDIGEVKDCQVPFGMGKCARYSHLSKERKCFVDPVTSDRDFNCEYLLDYMHFKAYNFLILSPPYINILLNITKIHTFDIVLLKPSNKTFQLDLRYLIDLIRLATVKIKIDLNNNQSEIILIVNSMFLENLTWHLKCQDSLISLTFSPEFGRTKNTSILKNNVICYNFKRYSIDNRTEIEQIQITCPTDRCEMNGNKSNICLGLRPCHFVEDTRLLCRIDRLHSNDRILYSNPLLISELFILTTNNRTDILHTLSQHLLTACIAERLIIVVLHGLLQVPKFNSTSIVCSSNLVRELYGDVICCFFYLDCRCGVLAWRLLNIWNNSSSRFRTNVSIKII